MPRSRLVVLIATVLACAPAATRIGLPVPTRSPTAEEMRACCGREVLSRGLAIADRFEVDAIRTRRFTHEEYWAAIAPSLASDVFRTEVIGRSILGREIRAITYGAGPTRVLLWSQMHGDESTASMALADIFRFLTEGAGDPLRDRLRDRLTVTFVPMLNPDGAQLFQRENAVGIDVNRDGRQLATPEARALKSLRDRIQPAFGFNLHDQNVRTRAGPAGAQAAIALLAPATNESRDYNDVRSRARLVAATIAQLLGHELAGRVSKYDDTFNPRAFGDLMQAWGTSTVLIESGGFPGDPEKQRLRAYNVAAILGALDAIATRSYEFADPTAYERLPENASGTNANDLLIRGGSIVLPGAVTVRADIMLNFDDPAGRTGGRIRDVGDLREATARDTIDAGGLYIHPLPDALTTNPAGGAWLRLNSPATFELRRGPDPTSELVRNIP
jgi:hypothetical protein